MPRAQFADRKRYWRCDECDWRSFSDQTKVGHWPTCSQYRAWRFGDVEGVRTVQDSAPALSTHGLDCPCTFCDGGEWDPYGEDA